MPMSILGTGLALLPSTVLQSTESLARKPHWRHVVLKAALRDLSDDGALKWIVAVGTGPIGAERSGGIA